MRSLNHFRYALTALFLLSAATQASAAEGIQVNGRGVVNTVPDMGTVNLHIRREGDDPAALEAAMNQVVGQVLKLTRKLDIAEKDVTAALVSIQPRYQRRNDETVVSGVIASRTVTITVRRLADFPKLLQQSLELGVNNVDPIALDSSRRVELEAQALDLAMADAISRADQVAAGFSVRRGSVVDVRVSTHNVMPRMAMQEMRVGAADDAFAPGEIRIEQNVDATFAISSEG
jgi:hypothetical protein